MLAEPAVCVARKLPMTLYVSTDRVMIAPDVALRIRKEKRDAGEHGIDGPASGAAKPAFQDLVRILLGGEEGKPGNRIRSDGAGAPAVGILRRGGGAGQEGRGGSLHEGLKR
jgi:hypothetical protein